MEALIKKAKSALKKYEDYVNKLHKNKEFKTGTSKESDIEKLLEKEIKKYPVIKDADLFNSLHTVYKKIKDYLKKGNSEELKNYMRDIENKLFTPNLRYVRTIATKYENEDFGMELGDLIDEGSIGLMKALEKYDSKKGVPFIAYAKSWIRQGILKAKGEKSRLIRMPLNKVARSIKIHKMKEELEGKLERKPTNKELSDSTNVPPQEIKEIEILFLDDLIRNRDTPLSDYIVDRRYTFEEKLVNCNLINNLSKGAKLKDRERKILKEWASGKNLKEIGDEFGLTRERVRQIKDRSIEKMRANHSEGNVKEELGIRVR